MAADTAQVNVVQITLWMTGSQRLIVKANSGGRNPATGNNPGYVFDGNIEENEGTVQLAEEVLKKLLIAYPSKQNVSLPVEDDEIVPTVLSMEKGLVMPADQPKLSKKECEQLQAITKVWPEIPAGLRQSLSSLIKKIAKESSK